MTSATTAAATTTTATTKPAPAPRPTGFSFPLPQHMHASIVAFLSPRSQVSLTAAMNTKSAEKGPDHQAATAPPTVAGGIEEGVN